MQIKDNITVTFDVDNPRVEPKPIKMVKLRSEDVFVQNAKKLIQSALETQKQEEVSKEVPKEDEVQAKEVTESKVVEMPKEEVKEEAVPLPFTSEEVIRSKKDLLGIEAYKDIESNIVNLASYQNARRLRVNEVVVGNANRERNINGGERVKEEKTTLTPENKPFDFGSFESFNETGINDTQEVEENANHYNNNKLDEWLNKETSRPSSSNDMVLNEVNELQTKLNDNTSSLATQKEILEALRARIANNEALCKQRKQELEEENMNVTRELNDVLAEITKLTSLANEQEAFLGIQNDDETMGKGMAA